MRRTFILRRSRTADWARLCGGLSVPVLVLAVIGVRAGLVPAPALLPALIVGFVLAGLAFGAAIYALTDIWNNGAEGGRAAVAGMVYASPALALLGLIAYAAVAYPRLTDVTTNISDPPVFFSSAHARLPRRQDMVVQRQAYPRLVTRDYPLPLGEVYAAVRKVIEARGWTITRETRPNVMPEMRTEAAVPRIGESAEIDSALARKSVMTQSRGTGAAPPKAADESGPAVLPSPGNVATLEAVAPTPVFRFTDDVVVRLRGSPEGTEVDMRSASRTGGHDLGQNARRIKAFFAKLDAELHIESEGSSSGIAALIAQ